MRLPRHTIASVMRIVFFVALNLAAIRALLQYDNLIAGLLLCSLPMTNLLVIGLVLGLPSHRGRRFFLGFETSGVMAMALFAALAFFHGSAFNGYFSVLDKLLWWITGGDPVFLPDPIAALIVMVWLSLPQVAFALAGGVLANKFRIKFFSPGGRAIVAPPPGE